MDDVLGREERGRGLAVPPYAIHGIRESGGLAVDIVSAHDVYTFPKSSTFSTEAEYSSRD